MRNIPFYKIRAAQAYSAILSCGFNGSHINIAACFLDTDLKFTNNGQTAITRLIILTRQVMNIVIGCISIYPKAFGLPLRIVRIIWCCPL